MPQDPMANVSVKQSKKPRSQAEQQGTTDLRGLIIPAQVGPEAAQKRRALRGKLQGAFTFQPGWDAPEDE